MRSEYSKAEAGRIVTARGVTTLRTYQAGRCTWRSVVAGVLLVTACAVPRGAADLITILNLHPAQVPYNNQSFSGTGYVGLSYWAAMNTERLNAGMGWGEGSPFSTRTVLQVDIAGLSGTIPGAYLSFELKDGSEDAQNVTVTSFTSTGTILGGPWSDFWNPPDYLGSAVYSIQGKEPNSIDVTDLLQARIDAGAGWFGLHIQGHSTAVEHWTMAASDTDRAEVRLTVIPEPGTLLLLALSAGGALAWRRIRMNTRS